MALAQVGELRSTRPPCRVSKAIGPRPGQLRPARDRAARLEHIHWLEARLDESERDRAARLEYIHQLQRQAREQENAIGILRANVEGLQRQVGYLSTASGAARVLGGAGLQKVGLYGLAHRHRGLLKKLVPIKGPPCGVVAGVAQKRPPRDTASLLDAPSSRDRYPAIRKVALRSSITSAPGCPMCSASIPRRATSRPRTCSPAVARG